MPTAYQEFVKKNISRAPAQLGPKDKMRWIAAQWRRSKGQAGAGGSLLAGGCADGDVCEAVEVQEGKGARRPKKQQIVVAAPPEFTGGAAWNMEPANQFQVGGGFFGDLFPPAKLLGLGVPETHGAGFNFPSSAKFKRTQQRGGNIFEDVLGGIGKVATATKVVPLAAMFL